MRTLRVLAALLSPTWGIYSGYELCENTPVRPGSEEYLDSEKYQYRPRDWAAAEASHVIVDVRPFADLIETVSLKHGVDPALVHAVVQVESNYQPKAVSGVGARGLMQVLPSTAADFGVRNLFDPQANLEAGVQYLKFLLTRFNLSQAIAAYNAGPAIVRKYQGIPPFPETQDYVKRVLAAFQR